MSEYTYADVIIDPNDPRVEIGAKYYRSDFPKRVLHIANNDEDYIGTLENIDTESPETPFVIKTGGAYSPWACIIRKKEPEKRYVPFDLNSEKDRDFLRGKWMRSKNLDEEGFIDYFWKIDREGVDVWKAHMSNHGVIYAHHLLSNYVFLDGSPVGKLVEVTDGN